MLMTRLSSACFLFAATAQVIAAEPDAAAKTAPAYGAGLSSSGLMETAGGLILVLILIVGLAWLYRRVGHMPAGGKGMLRVAGGISLGSRERVVVVEVEDKRLVLGVAPGRVQTLMVLDSVDDAEEPESFTHQLKSQLQGTAS